MIYKKDKGALNLNTQQRQRRRRRRRRRRQRRQHLVVVVVVGQRLRENVERTSEKTKADRKPRTILILLISPRYVFYIVNDSGGSYQIWYLI